MKKILVAVLCLLTIAVFSFAFANSSTDTGQKNQPEAVQKNDSDQMTQEAKELPTALITDEERNNESTMEQELNVNPWQLRYNSIPSNTE